MLVSTDLAQGSADAHAGNSSSAVSPLLFPELFPGALGEYFASPIAADGKVFLANTEGKITVLKAGAQWEVLSVNEIDDEVSATPALSDGRVYVRTHGALYCFSTSR